MLRHEPNNPRTTSTVSDATLILITSSEATRIKNRCESAFTMFLPHAECIQIVIPDPWIEPAVIAITIADF